MCKQYAIHKTSPEVHHVSQHCQKYWATTIGNMHRKLVKVRHAVWWYWQTDRHSDTHTRHNTLLCYKEMDWSRNQCMCLCICPLHHTYIYVHAALDYKMQTHSIPKVWSRKRNKLIVDAYKNHLRIITPLTVGPMVLIFMAYLWLLKSLPTLLAPWWPKECPPWIYNHLNHRLCMVKYSSLWHNACIMHVYGGWLTVNYSLSFHTGCGSLIKWHPRENSQNRKAFWRHR